jgi:hypothetical protein
MEEHMSRKIAAPKSPGRKLALVPLLIVTAAVAAFPAGAATGDSSITGSLIDSGTTSKKDAKLAEQAAREQARAAEQAAKDAAKAAEEAARQQAKAAEEAAKAAQKAAEEQARADRKAEQQLLQSSSTTNDDSTGTGRKLG